jgi:ubiquinone/menaquinone biosynthesis C-methylase UbiE
MSDDLKRLETAYNNRNTVKDSDLYSLANPGYLFAIQQRERSVLKLLRKHHLLPLSDKRILEVGCGRGGVLREYVRYGALPHQLHGVDYLLDRVETARQNMPTSCWIHADGQQLPYPDSSFDLVLQYTALSSLLDARVRAKIAAEMMRVLKKEGGAIIWYDFWLNPKNDQTHGLRQGEIRTLFPEAKFDFSQITLAPPLARRLVPISWTSAILLEKVRFLNSHYLVAINAHQSRTQN